MPVFRIEQNLRSTHCYRSACELDLIWMIKYLLFSKQDTVCIKFARARTGSRKSTAPCRRSDEEFTNKSTAISVSGHAECVSNPIRITRAMCAAVQES